MADFRQIELLKKKKILMQYPLSEQRATIAKLINDLQAISESLVSIDNQMAKLPLAFHKNFGSTETFAMAYCDLDLAIDSLKDWLDWLEDLD